MHADGRGRGAGEGAAVTAMHLHYARDLDAGSWEARHDEGHVPDRWPYGLHHLLDHGIDLTPSHARWQPLVRVGRRLGGGYDWDRLFSGSGPALCWDERTGVPVALSGAPTLTGVIWLTEADRHHHVSDAMAGRALARTDIFVLSQLQVSPLVTRWGVPAGRVHHVPFGIDVGFWQPLERDHTGVLVVGNDRHRDHETAIRAAAATPARLTMVTQHRIDVPGVTHITSLGHRELREAYAGCEVVAIATKPNVHASGVTTLLEALACGRPVVATRGGGLEHYLTKDTGVLVDPGDHRAMAREIRSLLSDPARARDMGEAGRASVESRFSTARMGRDLAELARGLVG